MCPSIQQSSELNTSFGQPIGCSRRRTELAAATDTFGAVLFRGFGLESLADYESAMDGCGIVTGDFVGTAPRAKVGRYVVRNVSFEQKKQEEATPSDLCSPQGSSPLDLLRESAGMVWAEDNIQFFNFHNELAYMNSERHAALGYANYAFFCCTAAPDVGGYTLISDCRQALVKLRELLPGPELPVSFKFTIARKSLCTVRKDTTGDYEGFLTGDWEFEQYPDQWSPKLATREADIAARCRELGVQWGRDSNRDDIFIESDWVPLVREHPQSRSETLWCNVNHAVLGMNHSLLPFVFKYADGSVR